MKGSALLVMIAMAACVGAITAQATGASGPVLTLQAVAAIVVMEGFRRLDLPRTRLFAAGELLALVAVAGLGWWLGSPGEATSGLPIAGLVVSLIVWLLGAITATDLEAVAAPTDLVEGVGGATVRLRHRMLAVGAALGLLVISSATSYRLPSAPRELLSGLVLPFLVYWVVGLGGLSALHRQRLLARWARDGARVEADLAARWQRRIAGALTFVVGAGFFWWWSGRPVLGAAHQVSAWLVSAGVRTWARLSGEPLPPQFQRGEPAGELPPVPAPLNPIRPPGDLWDAVLIAGAGLLFGSVFLFWKRRRRAGTTRLVRAWPPVLGAVLRLLLEMLKALLGVFRGWRISRRMRLHSSTVTAEDLRLRRVWDSPDPIRRRIAAAFRRQAALAAAHVDSPRVAETVLEYSARVEPDPRMSDLATIYSEARYSHHQLEPRLADAAEELDRSLAGAWHKAV